MKNTIKNHIYVCLDKSGSMSDIIDSAVKVFNNQIDYLRKSSLAFEQETRISFYWFDNAPECVISDVDVARPVKLEEVEANGMTSLMDAVTLAIDDAKLVSQKYGDHSFVLYVITDGEENTSKTPLTFFKKTISSLPDNFTIAAFVPDINGITNMVHLGFPKGNVEKWDTTAKGIEEVGAKFSKTIDSFFTGRKAGIRSCKTMFDDLRQVNSKNVKKVLDEVKKYDIVINEQTKAIQIKDLVEKKTRKSYIKGGSFYELVKTEHIQPQKEIAVQNKKTGKVYTGDNARQLLNLPSQTVKIVPEDFGEWIVYVQSTSVNRNVIPKQRILVMS